MSCDCWVPQYSLIRQMGNIKEGKEVQRIYLALCFVGYCSTSTISIKFLPAGVAHLDTGLANVNGDTFSHRGLFLYKGLSVGIDFLAWGLRVVRWIEEISIFEFEAGGKHEAAPSAALPVFQNK